ncbi:MAG: 2-amino-4-hydroxy-6-hydroxymethyldihydropteridine diphosphokinase [Acidimicrobiaceae bacterium]|nr:2-amino-4-hydroxy-6-hydroxymethyldihydropteridine diphosphokinase [Acidimicrobiaceae bacterium]
MRRAYLSLGSNLGDRVEYLRTGVRIAVGDDPYRVSKVYQTEPVGGVAQDDFWNLVVEISTSATARELLRRCQAAELACGRVRDQRWGPRTLDVDVLLVGDETSDDPEIVVPHPRLFARSFVMVPLHELAPELVSPEQLAGGVGRVEELGTLETLR